MPPSASPASTVSTLYIATAAAHAGAHHVARRSLAFAIGVPLSLLAASVPAREGEPRAADRRHARHDRLESRVRLRARRWSCRRWSLGGGLRAGAAGARRRPAAVRLRLVVCDHHRRLAAGAGHHLRARARRSARRCARLLGVEGLLAHANLAAAIPRLSISIAALAVSLSMMVAVAVMIGSFRETVAYWVGQTLQADLFVGPGVQPTVGSEQTLSAPVIDAVRAHPDVEAVDTFRNIDLVYRGNLVVLGAGNFDIVLSHGSLLFKAPADGRDALRRAHRHRIGDRVRGVREQVRRQPRRHAHAADARRRAAIRASSAVYYDYAVDRGVIVMDRATFVQYFGELAPTGIAAYLEEGADPERVRAEILASAGRGPPRVHLHQSGPARRGAARLRQHVCHHLRARRSSPSSSPCSAWPRRC